MEEFIEITNEGEDIRIRGQFSVKDDGSVQKKIDEILSK